MGLINLMGPSVQADMGIPTDLYPRQKAPIVTGKPVYEAPEKKGFFERLGSGAMEYLGDPTNRARLAAAFNTMRLNPDPNIARMAQSQIETQQALDLLKGQGTRTAEWLKSVGREDLAQLVLQQPAMAKTAVAEALKKPDVDFSGLSEEAAGAISGIRKEFMSIPEVKAFQSQANSFGRITASAEDPSAAGDLALIFNYMKLLDPGSVVREGEFATAQNATGVPDRIQNIYNNVLRGTRLNEDQRNDFVSRAEKIYSDAERQYENYESQYKKFMNRFIPEGTGVEEFFPSLRYVKARTDVPNGIDPEIWNAMTEQERDAWRAEANG